MAGTVGARRGGATGMVCPGPEGWECGLHSPYRRPLLLRGEDDQRDRSGALDGSAPSCAEPKPRAASLGGVYSCRTASAPRALAQDSGA